MNCPKCKSRMDVEDSRKHARVIRRRRKCVVCGHVERTIEIIGDCPTTINAWIKDRKERDRAIGALGVLVYDGVISSGRMRELLDMDVYQQREELTRLLGE